MKFRHEIKEGERRNNPPPNSYHLNHAMTSPNKFSAISFGFGNRVNVAGKILDNPGPGTYKPPDAVLKKRKNFTLRQRFNCTSDQVTMAVKRNVPGPGSYDVLSTS